METEHKPSHFDKKVISLAALIIALSVGYYYAIALPRQNQAKLELEQQKYRDEKSSKEEVAKKEESVKQLETILLDGCLDTADKNYWTYMKLNGTEKPDGTVFADQRFWDNAAATKKSETDTCFKQYPQK